MKSTATWHTRPIDKTEQVYEGTIKDDFDDKKLPVGQSLRLKLGAQVILTRNDPEKRWVNGSLAKIAKLTEDEIDITLKRKFVKTPAELHQRARILRPGHGKIAESEVLLGKRMSIM